MTRKTTSANRRGRQSGSAILEFGLATLFMIPVFMGSMSVGMGLGLTTQVAEVARDAGHMFARQVDFSQSANQQLIVRLASGMGLSTTGNGTGVVVLTKVMQISSVECTSAGYTTSTCTNINFPVITQRVTIGSTASGFFTSNLGTPPTSFLQSDGTITPANYLTQISCRANTLVANGGSGLLTLQPSEITYISEGYFQSAALAFLNNNTPLNVYSRNYF
ncbi:MAG: hypothetical protein HYZ37_02205 [Candidatus Solibacter usitatus]|nr:hypothetical protein [Candidatus Solibacter usitatus]